MRIRHFFMIFIAVLTAALSAALFCAESSFAVSSRERRKLEAYDEQTCTGAGNCWYNGACYHCGGEELDVYEQPTTGTGTESYEGSRSDMPTTSGSNRGGGGSEDAEADADAAVEEACEEVYLNMMTNGAFEACGEDAPSGQRGRICNDMSDCAARGTYSVTECFENSLCDCYGDLAREKKAEIEVAHELWQDFAFTKNQTIATEANASAALKKKISLRDEYNELNKLQRNCARDAAELYNTYYDAPTDSSGSGGSSSGGGGGRERNDGSTPRSTR